MGSASDLLMLQSYDDLIEETGGVAKILEAMQAEIQPKGLLGAPTMPESSLIRSLMEGMQAEPQSTSKPNDSPCATTMSESSPLCSLKRVKFGPLTMSESSTLCSPRPVRIASAPSSDWLVGKPPASSSSVLVQDEITPEKLFNMCLDMYQHVEFLQSCIQAQQYARYTSADSFLNASNASLAASTQHLPPSPSGRPILSRDTIRIRDLDPWLLPVFRECPTPNAHQLTSLCRQVALNYPLVGKKELLSAIRKWFRVSRDNNCQMVFEACDQHLRHRVKGGELSIEEVRADYKAQGSLYQAIARESALEIKEPLALTTFLQEKIESYIVRRLTGNSKRTISVLLPDDSQ